MTRELPDGWVLGCLGDVVSSIRSGVSVNSEDRETRPGELGVLKTSCVTTGVFRPAEHKAVIAADLHRVAEPVEAGTVVVSRMNTPDLVGASGYIPTSFPHLFLPDRLWAVRANSGVFPRWLSYVVSDPSMRVRIKSAANGTSGSMKNLSQDSFLALPISIPPLPEQRRIAAALQAWDDAIDRVERLIIAKQRHKRALLQIAFRSLPMRPLLEAATVWFSGVDKKTKPGEQEVLLCNYMDVFHNARITRHLPFMRSTASRREIAQNALRRNDVVFTKDSETADEIAEPALVDDDIQGLVCGYHLAVARPIEGRAYGPFIAQAMRHPKMRWQFSRLANGVVRFGLTLDAIEQAEIFLPDLDFQVRIASALDAEDRSIEALSALAASRRVQRRGLIQRLLTGQWRVDREAA